MYSLVSSYILDLSLNQQKMLIFSTDFYQMNDMYSVLASLFQHIWTIPNIVSKGCNIDGWLFLG